MSHHHWHGGAGQRSVQARSIAAILRERIPTIIKGGRAVRIEAHFGVADRPASPSRGTRSAVVLSGKLAISMVAVASRSAFASIRSSILSLSFALCSDRFIP